MNIPALVSCKSGSCLVEEDRGRRKAMELELIYMEVCLELVGSQAALDKEEVNPKYQREQT